MYTKVACLSFVFAGMTYATNTDSFPLIYLTNNFGEDTGLCLDISGGTAALDCGAPLQIHTCKQNPQDTQFWYDGSNRQIKSYNYRPNCEEAANDNQRGCVTVDGIYEGSFLTLSRCLDDSRRQEFVLAENGQIQLEANTDFCLGTVGGDNEATSGTGSQAFVRRDLQLTRCDIDATLVDFQVVDEDGTTCEVGATCRRHRNCCGELLCVNGDNGKTCQNWS